MPEVKFNSFKYSFDNEVKSQMNSFKYSFDNGTKSQMTGARSQIYLI